MKNIYLYTDTKDRCTNARLQEPAIVGDICRIYVNGQYTATAQACMIPSHGASCHHCCIYHINSRNPTTCLIPVEYFKEADDYLGQVCCGGPGCYFKDVAASLEDL